MVELIIKRLKSPLAYDRNFAHNLRQCYEHRRFKNELCPTEDEMAGFRSFIDSFYGVSPIQIHLTVRVFSLILAPEML